jgi:hypothetical protein
MNRRATFFGFPSAGNIANSNGFHHSRGGSKIASKMRRSQAILITTGLVAATLTSGAQQAPQAPPQSGQVLVLKLLLDKKIYSLREKIATRGELTNVSKEVVCFPKPATTSTNDYPGYVKLVAEPPPNLTEHEIFINHYDGAYLGSRQQMRAAIRKDWIKLAPNESYGVDSGTFLDGAGHWNLRLAYQPPQGAFNPTRVREFLKSSTEEEGCLLPRDAVSSEPLSIDVLPASVPRP